MEISLRTPVPLFRSGSVHSGSQLIVSQGSGGQAFLNGLRASLFPRKGFHTMLGQPTPTSLGQKSMSLCTVPSALLAE